MFIIYIFCIKYFSPDLDILTTLSFNSLFFLALNMTDYQVDRIQLRNRKYSYDKNQGSRLYHPCSPWLLKDTLIPTSYVSIFDVRTTCMYCHWTSPYTSRNYPKCIIEAITGHHNSPLP